MYEPRRRNPAFVIIGAAVVVTVPIVLGTVIYEWLKPLPPPTPKEIWQDKVDELHARIERIANMGHFRSSQPRDMTAQAPTSFLEAATAEELLAVFPSLANIIATDRFNRIQAGYFADRFAMDETYARELDALVQEGEKAGYIKPNETNVDGS